MRFRTEIIPEHSGFKIDHDSGIVMLGSCFIDEVGKRLAAEGFPVVSNPLGPVYNPVTLAEILDRALSGGRNFTESDLTAGPRGHHCLTFASRYSGKDAETVLESVNSDFQTLAESLRKARTVILTLGSAYVFTLRETGKIAGNCHKLPAGCFTRRRLPVEEVTDALCPQLKRLSEAGVNVILTVSPIRHLADGLHGNTLGKAVLQLAADRLCHSVSGVEYFPSYEILIDDLRDYRFYAADMKHPSDVAVDYIYEIFSKVYFTPETVQAAKVAAAEYKLNNHRQILQ